MIGKWEKYHIDDQWEIDDEDESSLRSCFCVLVIISGIIGIAVIYMYMAVPTTDFLLWTTGRIEFKCVNN